MKNRLNVIRIGYNKGNEQGILDEGLPGFLEAALADLSGDIDREIKNN